MDGSTSVQMTSIVLGPERSGKTFFVMLFKKLHNDYITMPTIGEFAFYYIQ